MGEAAARPGLARLIRSQAGRPRFAECREPIAQTCGLAGDNPRDARVADGRSGVKANGRKPEDAFEGTGGDVDELHAAIGDDRLAAEHDPARDDEILAPLLVAPCPEPAPHEGQGDEGASNVRAGHAETGSDPTGDSGGRAERAAGKEGHDRDLEAAEKPQARGWCTSVHNPSWLVGDAERRFTAVVVRSQPVPAASEGLAHVPGRRPMRGPSPPRSSSALERVSGWPRPADW